MGETIALAPVEVRVSCVLSAPLLEAWRLVRGWSSAQWLQWPLRGPVQVDGLVRCPRLGIPRPRGLRDASFREKLPPARGFPRIASPAGGLVSGLLLAEWARPRWTVVPAPWARRLFTDVYVTAYGLPLRGFRPTLLLLCTFRSCGGQERALGRTVVAESGAA